ncbi:helix-turn-helix domain-containing protein [Amycolatopsis nigrescens]|uniref:helix-turn-helix domain-containing protein n=1 Tax=Amycolatopsis nigrescens TaxID=381445 RepID=UPI00037BE15D|nr:helix-turn-helix domain-containing protein [Amycolatopsis nigrescens]
MNSFGTDARSLSADALEALRRRAVAAVESGMSQVEAARLYGVSRKTVGVWVRAHRQGGEQAFRARRRGRHPGAHLALAGSQQAWLFKTILNGPPDEAGLRYRVWTRAAVAELINREFGIPLSATTVGQYLVRWQLVPESNMLDVLRHGPVPELPVQRRTSEPVACRISEPGAEVLWVAWTRVRPPLEICVEYQRADVLLAVSNRATLFFLANRHAYEAEQIFGFSARLRDQLKRNIKIVVCWWPVEKFELLRTWMREDPCVTVLNTDSPFK